MIYLRHQKMQHTQDGQTLIETMVAIFILVTGIVAALGLSIFAFNTSNNVTQQIIATGLAREGIEAVKNIRDTNWLQQTTIDANCYNYVNTSANDAKCYRNWETQWINISPPSGSKPYALSIDPTDPNFWQIKTDAQSKFGLQFNPNFSSPSFKGFYSTDVNNPQLDGTANFYRTVTITEIKTSPFDVDAAFPELLVDSQVWWRGAKCPTSSTYAGALSSCRIDIQTYLTNWKNY